MAPPTNKPRLNLIDPEAAAITVTAEASRRFQALAHDLFDVPVVPAAPESRNFFRFPIYQTVRKLAEYATTGKKAATFDVMAAIHTLDYVADRYEEREDNESSYELGVIVGACYAREKIGAGEAGSLTVRDLATLASLSIRQVRELVSNGELPSRAPSYLKFLRERGVEGV